MTAGARFSERYVWSAFPEGGVVLDLEVGTYFRANATVLHVCEALAASTATEQVARDVAARLKIDVPTAEGAIAQILSDLHAQAEPKPIGGAFVYRSTGSGYALFDGDRPFIEVDTSGRSVRLCLPARDSPMPVQQALRSLMPKMFLLQGMSVLHVSSCLMSDNLLAFGGASGAGKTTTVRAFAEAGAKVVSEDTLVVSWENGVPSVFLDSEKALRAFAARGAARLQADPTGPIDCGELQSIANGPRRRIDRLWFLDPARRQGIEFQTVMLPKAEALVEFLDGSFLASHERGSWRRYFTECTGLATHVETLRATTPESVAALLAAARRYSASSAS